MNRLIPLLSAAALLVLVSPALAVQEFYVGEPVVQEGMQIVPNYLTGVEMDRDPPGMGIGRAIAVPEVAARFQKLPLGLVHHRNGMAGGAADRFAAIERRAVAAAIEARQRAAEGLVDLPEVLGLRGRLGHGYPSITGERGQQSRLNNTPCASGGAASARARPAR